MDKSAILAPNVNSLSCFISKFFWKLFDWSFLRYVFSIIFQFAAFIRVPVYTPKLYTTYLQKVSLLKWNETTLIRICVEEAGADHLFSIQGTIFLMPLMLLKTIFHKVDVETWNNPKICRILAYIFQLRSWKK